MSHGYSDVAMRRNYNRKHLERSPRTVGHETAWPLIALIGHAADSYWPFSSVLSQARRARYRKEVVCDFFVRPSASRTAILQPKPPTALLGILGSVIQYTVNAQKSTMRSGDLGTYATFIVRRCHVSKLRMLALPVWLG